MQILEGGRQHHLPHVGDKFVKMVPKSLLSDNIPTDIPGYIKKLNIDMKNARLDLNDPTIYLQTKTAEGKYNINILSENRAIFIPFIFIFFQKNLIK
jgi:hypothetical protein